MHSIDTLNEKVNEIIVELRKVDLWVQEPPVWVRNYQGGRKADSQEFLEWLQFVYLPNMLPQSGNHHTLISKNYVAPQAVKFFGDDLGKGKLLQLLIELDAIS